MYDDDHPWLRRPEEGPGAGRHSERPGARPHERHTGLSGVRFQDTWLRGTEDVEMGIVSDRYDLTLTLLYFEHMEWKRDFGNEEPDEEAELEPWTPQFCPFSLHWLPKDLVPMCAANSHATGEANEV